MKINNFYNNFFEICLKYFFNQLDKNGDGVISVAEFLSLIDQDEEVSLKYNEGNEDSSVDKSSDETSSEEKNTDLNYDKIKEVWMDYYTELKSGEWEKKAKEEAKYYMENDTGEHWTEEACYNLYAIPAYEYAVKTAASDINGDGKFDKKDYEAFNTHVDLDGDGRVSAKEHKYLEDVKAYMDYALAEKAYCDASATNDIDIVIESLEILDENRMARFKEKALEDIYTWESYSCKKGIDRHKLSDDDILGRGAGHILLPAIPQLKDAMKEGLLTCDIITTPLGELKGMILNCMDYYSPATQFLRYINKYKKLPKEKLEEILSKINSASASVQSQLAEVKAEVQKRLDDMN